MLSSCRADNIETDCRKISWTVGNSVAGALIVGRYLIASDVHSLYSIVKNSLFDRISHAHAPIGWNITTVN